MKRIFIFSLFLMFCFNVNAQNKISIIVRDSITKELLPGAIIAIKANSQAVSTDGNGQGVLSNIADGSYTINVSLLGYRPKLFTLMFPQEKLLLTIYLQTNEAELEEVIISTSRTNSRIEDLPEKIEVLGQEDMDEESSMVPSGIGSILGDLSVITIQRTNPVNGNDVVRMQGLDARYTQIMRDGLPLYSGFSGSLGVLSIPPLDLKQVEIIKGSASTLYGGGAISGLINFISKAPTDSAVNTLSLNVNTLNETNFNTFISKKLHKVGFTLFGGTNIKQAVDVNGDGFTDVPESQNFSVHPKLFFYINKHSELNVGVTSVYDNRQGGDIRAILNAPDSLHSFIQKEKTFRNTIDAVYTNTVSSTNTITFKTAVSNFKRDIHFSNYDFNALQYASYSELNDVIRIKNNTLVLGLSVTSEQFKKQYSDSVNFNNFNNYTYGIFAQDDWKITEKLLIQPGLRVDHHSLWGIFVLPRLSFYYKPSSNWSVRLAAGTGYKAPNIFDFAIPAPNVSDALSGLKPEKSYGVNADIDYHTVLFDKIGLQLNQAFYYTHITNPVIMLPNTGSIQSLVNAIYDVNSYGSDTYLRLTFNEIELYLGYNHTEALQQTTNTSVNLPFNPKDKFSTTLAYSIEGKWRMGVEGSYSGNQYISNNYKVPSFWFLAAMVERKFANISLVLNCENLFDLRQSQYGTLVDGILTKPVFKPLWGPTEGRVINFAIKISL